MAYFKCVNQSYQWENTISNLCAYILDNRKTMGYVGGINVRPETAELEISAIQKAWGKQQGRRMRQYIISFADEEAVTSYEALEMGYRIGAYYAANYQIIFGVHVQRAPGEHLHIHFGMSTVSFVDGRKYSGAYQDYYCLCRYIQEVLREYGCKLDQSEMMD